MFAFFIIAIINLFLILFMVIVERKNLSRISLWLLVFTFLPIISFIIYLLIGVGVLFKNKKTNKIYNDNLIQKQNYFNNFNIINGKFSEIQRFNLLNNHSLLLTNESCNIYAFGNELIKDLKKDIINAKKCIYILSYIFADDNIGCEIKKLLKQKAKRGVEIILIYDGFGSKKTKSAFFKDLKKHNIKVLEFFPPLLKLKFLQLSINYRNHRKIFIIDNKIGYIGGFNIRDDHFNKDKFLSPWRDTHVRIVGNSVIELLNVFIKDYKLCNKKINTETFNINYSNIGNINAQLLNSSALIGEPKIEESLIKAIYSAKKEIIISSPYFVLDNKIFTALKTGLLSNKTVEIYIPKIPDKKFVYNASLYYCKELLKFGAKVYLYKGFMHSKTLLIDREIFVVGSSNFDIRSFSLNFESSLMIFNKKVGKDYYNQILNDKQNSEQITYNFYKKMPTLKKLAILISKLFSPIL